MSSQLYVTDVPGVPVLQHSGKKVRPFTGVVKPPEAIRQNEFATLKISEQVDYLSIKAIV